MEDLGQPISYLVVKPGVPVYSSDGERLGRLVKVLSAPEASMFDGIVIDVKAGPGGHRFVDAPEVGELYDGGVVLKVDAAVAARLPKPSANPGSLAVDPGDLAPPRHGPLRRFWDSLLGRR